MVWRVELGDRKAAESRSLFLQREERNEKGVESGVWIVQENRPLTVAGEKE